MNKKILLRNKLIEANKEALNFVFNEKKYYSSSSKAGYFIQKLIDFISDFVIFLAFILFIVIYFGINSILEKDVMPEWIKISISIFTIFLLYGLVKYILYFVAYLLFDLRTITKEEYFEINKDKVNKEEKKSFWQKYKEYKAKYDENNR
ncbi:hypothetical protein [Arcobacter vandammei]|uniref:hypothetical protein n=1 Tax=Arcobacter vandammei TaxID=2782243 RepID=UPI0018DF408F|nr:hypothetical protein [Arcobacter vandammei]